MRNDPNYPTIRQYAKIGALSEHCLRLMCRQGKLPGFYVGNHFRIDRVQFEAQLRNMSATNENLI